MINYVKDKTVFKQNLDIHIQYMNFKYEPLHTHDFFEFVYMLSGSMINLINGVSYELKEGSIAIMDCDQTHEIISNDENNIAYVNILISKEFLSHGEINNIYDMFSFVALQQVNKNDNFVPIFTFEGKEKDDFQKVVLAMLDEYNNQQENYEKILSHYLYIIILKLLRRLDYSKDNSVIVDLDEKITEIMEYIEENYCHDINLSMISEKFFYNSSYFSRLFKKMFGVTFNGYIQDLRIKRAINLLDCTNLSIEQISAQVGYSDKKQFYLIFKKKTGTTPSKYKRNILKNGKM